MTWSFTTRYSESLTPRANVKSEDDHVSGFRDTFCHIPSVGSYSSRSYYPSFLHCIEFAIAIIMPRSRNPLSTIPEIDTDDHPTIRESILFLDEFLPLPPDSQQPHSSNQTPRLSPPISPMNQEAPTSPPNPSTTLLSRIVRSVHDKLTSFLHLRPSTTTTTNNNNNNNNNTNNSNSENGPKPSKRAGPSEENLAEPFMDANPDENADGNRGQIDAPRVYQELDLVGQFLMDLEGWEERRERERRSGRRRWLRWRGR